MMRPLSIALATVLSAAGLCGCGKQGDLDQPGPLWGARAKAEYEAQRRALAETKTNEAQGNQIETLPDEGPGSDPTTNPAPPRTLPIPGMRPDPSQQSQPGALPDPYARPQ